jgi:divalent metal cation (Fe/Co/Zn/Cd) transporter
VTIGWNAVECGVALYVAATAHSVVLLAYGFDSLIEVATGAVIGFRLFRELRGADTGELRRTEAWAAKVSGVLLVVLAFAITIESATRLTGRGPAPEGTLVGMALTGLAALVMPGLSWAKLRVARRLWSRAVRMEALQTIACAWFSLTALAGLTLNRELGWWWADPASSLILVPWLAWEGLEPWRS